jgi:glutathione S-transferase
MAAARPVLWQLAVSHFSEKARWALAYKQVPHERRAPAPGVHIAVALWLTGGRCATLPVLQLDGATIGGSGAIVAALEERYPDPPLYPADPSERRRALALQAWFDAELGPPARKLIFHDIGHDRDRMNAAVQIAAPDIHALLGPAATAYATVFTKVRYGTHPDGAAERARERILVAFDRLEAELGDDEYLVGGRFSVADLAAAALFFPVVLPPEAPRMDAALPDSYERFRATVRDRRGYRWVEEMFRRHRRKDRRVAEQAVGVAA